MANLPENDAVHLSLAEEILQALLESLKDEGEFDGTSIDALSQWVQAGEFTKVQSLLAALSKTDGSPEGTQ